MPEEITPPLYEPFAVQEIALDGFFDDAHVEGETFRCTAFSMQSAPGAGIQTQPVAVVRLIMTPRTARNFIDQASQVLFPDGEKTRSIRDRRKPG